MRGPGDGRTWRARRWRWSGAASTRSAGVKSASSGFAPSSSEGSSGSSAMPHLGQLPGWSWADLRMHGAGVERTGLRVAQRRRLLRLQVLAADRSRTSRGIARRRSDTPRLMRDVVRRLRRSDCHPADGVDRRFIVCMCLHVHLLEPDADARDQSCVGHGFNRRRDAALLYCRMYVPGQAQVGRELARDLVAQAQSQFDRTQPRADATRSIFLPMQA